MGRGGGGVLTRAHNLRAVGALKTSYIVNVDFCRDSCEWFQHSIYPLSHPREQYMYFFYLRVKISGKSALPLFKNGATYVPDFDILELYGRGKVINLKKRGIGYWGLVSKVV